MNCDPTLYSLVFGESVLNDAVIIVLFHVFHGYANSGKPFTNGDIFIVLLEFLGITLGSVAIGIAFGLGISFAFKRTHIRLYHSYELASIILTAFGCFAFSELVDMSGVMSLFFCGITMAHYNFYNMSDQKQDKLKLRFRVARPLC